uniref:Uncharacterized protein n=1 Tax=Kalanchoe fedtschenkoi TaxID=63787 RepID=A0A7N0ZWL6_KALFE
MSRSLISAVRLLQTLPFANLTSLTFLDLAYNKFNSLIRTWLSNTSSLVDIFITGSGLIGRIPRRAFENMCNLRTIGLADNLLDGGLAELIDTLADCSNSSIQGLYLSDNKLRDYLPDSLGRLRNLEFLHLYSNSLFGSVPASIDWCPPFNLSVLRILDCQIGDSFPTWIESQTNLYSLTLSKTTISGVVPDWIWKLSTNLVDLDLSENKLHGNLSEMLMAKGPWGSVDLGNNLFESTLPRLRLSNISELSLKNNRISGVMPSDIFDQNPSLLLSLDLSGNMLYGNIPTKWDAREFLMYVDFSNNNLSGEVPETLCLLPSLVWLKLRNNNLFGEPCNSVSAFKGLKSIDLGENKFSGNIPKWRGDSLEDIRLHGNRISGHVPNNIGLLLHLESLDLSNNALDGHIPASLASITFLSKLNLSHNNLSGQIPSQYQFQTFDDPSIYEGNPGLCGLPLPRMCNPHKPDKDSSDDNGVWEKMARNVSEKMMLLASVVLGFIFGFWAVCGTLVVKKSWRDAYFRFLGI